MTGLGRMLAGISGAAAPDAGSTLTLLGISGAGLMALRRKLNIHG